MGHDRAELTGETLEEKDSQQYSSVRIRLESYALKKARRQKGLPENELQLDVDALSQLANSPIVDETAEEKSESKIIDMRKYSHNESIRALSIFQGRVKKKAA